MNTLGHYCVQGCLWGKEWPSISSVGSKNGSVGSVHVRDFLRSLRGGHSAEIGITCSEGLFAGEAHIRNGLSVTHP